MLRPLPLVALLTVISFVQTGSSAGDDVFTNRILPLARAERPSSCRECHLAGVDLSQYILDNEADTFAALREAGMIDVERPQQSKLLQFIRRAPENGDAVLAKVRAEELKAFEQWITAAATNPHLLAAKAPEREIGPEIPDEVIRYTRHDRVLQSFRENIWIEIERCSGCHDPTRNQRLIEKHGESISWITPDDPAATLAHLIENELIDVANPDKSVVLQKPLHEIPHGGHQKFAKGSRTDKQFRRFLHDYAAVVNGTYRTSADLPAPSERVLVMTGQHLRVTELPEDFGRRLMKVAVFKKTDGGWSREPIAVGDAPINGKRGMWQSPIFALVPRTPEAAREVLTRRALPAGRYLVRMYVDREGKLENNRDYELGEADLYKEVEVSGPWKPGWREPMIVGLEGN